MDMLPGDIGSRTDVETAVAQANAPQGQINKCMARANGVRAEGASQAEIKAEFDTCMLEPYVNAATP